MRRQLLPLCLVVFLAGHLGGWLAAAHAASAAKSSGAKAPGKAQGIDPGLLAGMKARSIGPAAMSGRVAAVAAVESDPETIYVGGATSGLWKSTDGGLTYDPIFDDQPVASIGAVAIFRRNPDVVWEIGRASCRERV